MWSIGPSICLPAYLSVSSMSECGNLFLRVPCVMNSCLALPLTRIHLYGVGFGKLTNQQAVDVAGFVHKVTALKACNTCAFMDNGCCDDGRGVVVVVVNHDDDDDDDDVLCECERSTRTVR